MNIQYPVSANAQMFYFHPDYKQYNTNYTIQSSFIKMADKTQREYTEM